MASGHRLVEFGHRRGLRHRQALPAVSGGARRSTTYTPPVEALGCERDEDDRDRNNLHLRDDVAEEADRDEDGDELAHGRKGGEHRGAVVFDGEQNERLPEGRRHGDDGDVGKRVRIRLDETPNVDELESHNEPGEGEDVGEEGRED